MATQSSSSSDKSTLDSRFIALHRSSLKQELFAFLALTLIVCISKHSSLFRIATHFIGGFERDAGLYIWLVKSNIRDLFSLPWFNTSAFYPYTRTLAWSDNFIAPSFAIRLLCKCGLEFIVSYNLTILLANTLNGFFAYRLFYRLTGSYLPALAGGGVFATLSYLGGHLGHPQLQFAFFIPLSLLLTVHFLESRSILWSIALGAVISLTYVTTVYYALFCVVVVALFLLGVILLQPQGVRALDYWKFLVGVSLGLIPVVPFVIPYLAVQGTFGERGIYEPYFFSATLLSYFSASSFSKFYSFSSGWSHSEATLFPGLIIILFPIPAILRVFEARPLQSLLRVLALVFLLTAAFSLSPFEKSLSQYLCAFSSWLTLALFCIALVRYGRLERAHGSTIITNRDLLLIFLFMAAMGFMISLGPLGNPEVGEFALGIHRALYEVVPGFSAIRAIGRFGLVTIFSLVAVFSLVSSHLLRKREISPFLFGAIALVALLENYNGIYPLEPESFGTSSIQYLKQTPDKDDAILVLPISGELDDNGQVKSWSEFAKRNVNYMNWLFDSRHPLVNGYSGLRSKIMKEFPRKMSGFPDERSMATISQIAGLKYIAYMSSLDSGFNKEEFLKKLSAHQSDLQFVNSDEDGTYLFEYTGMTQLGPEFQMLAPSFPDGILNIEVMSPAVKESPLINLDILAPDHLGDTPITHITFHADATWESFSLAIPRTSDSVRPLRLTFKATPNLPVFLKKSRYLADKGGS